ncbi:hypothetical protein ACWGJT_20210, partial [Streptomyces xantholiticus]
AGGRRGGGGARVRRPGGAPPPPHTSTAAHYGDYDDTFVWREVDGEKRVVRLTAAAASAYAPVHVVRIIRTLLRLDTAQLDPSALFLHAGMVSWQGHGLAVVGNKRSGKTSTVMAAAAAGADFVSNDDLSLHRGRDRLIGVGWPRSVSIRLDTLEPLGLRLPARPAHPSNKHRDEAQLLMPHEISRLLDCRIAPDAPLRTVLFPSFGADETSTLRRLDPQETAKRLLANLLTPPVKDDELTARFDLPSPEELSARVRQVAASVSAFELHQSLAQLARRTELAGILDQAVTAP